MSDNCVIAVHYSNEPLKYHDCFGEQLLRYHDRFNYYDASQISKFFEFNSYKWRSELKGDLAKFSASNEPFQPLRRPIETTNTEQMMSPFFDLPPELREDILERVFVNEEKPIGKWYDDEKSPFTSVVVVDRTDEDYDETKDRKKFVKNDRSWPGYIQGWVPRRDRFEEICIYFPASVMQLFTSKQFFEDALRVFARVTPLNITEAQIERVIPRLAQYPVLQRIIKVMAEHTRSLNMSTAPVNMRLAFPQTPQQLSSPSAQYFQHLREINLFCNPVLHWRSSDMDHHRGSFLVDRRIPWKETSSSLRRDSKTVAYTIPLRDAFDHDEQGKCFSVLISTLRSTLSETEGFKDAKDLIDLFRDHEVRPKVLFWQRVEYAVSWQKPHDCSWWLHSPCNTRFDTITRPASMVVAIDVEKFESVHFAADVHQWNNFGYYHTQDITFRPGREIKLQSKLAAKYGVLARILWPDRIFDHTGIEDHPRFKRDDGEYSPDRNITINSTPWFF